MFTNTTLSITEDYLVNLGVDVSNWDNIKATIYMLGGHPHNIEINSDAYVRVKNKPNYCRKTTLYTTTLRRKRIVNLQGENEILDVDFEHLPETDTVVLCNSLDYSENYQENAKMKQQTKAWIKNIAKNKRNHNKLTNGQISARG